MLRDLDARQSPSDSRGEYLPSGLRRRSGRGAWRIALVGFALGGVLLALWYGYFYGGSVAPAGGDAGAEPPAHTAVAKQALPASSASAASPAVASSSRRAVSDQPLQQHLLLAQAALGAGQLTTPINASAYWHYRQALQLEPDNPEALAGINQIAAYYVDRAEHLRARGEAAEARALLQRALSINPDNSAAQRLWAERPTTEPPAQALATPDSAASEPSQAPASRRAASPRSAPATVAKQSAAPHQAAGSAGIQISWETQDRQARRASERLAARGDLAQARAALTAFIARASAAEFAAPQARRYLHSLLLQSAELAAAERLIVPTLSAPQQYYLQARLQEHQGALDLALQTLEQGLEAAVADESYRAFAASLYQSTGRYRAAESHYRRLLEAFAPRARYWLGLALALDRQQRYSSAGVAYRRARRADDASATIVNFANRRLTQLAM
jgi:MSHA biogenesis protein MshN